MAFQQAQTSIFNRRAKHHWAVWVDTVKSHMIIYCADCDDSTEFAALSRDELLRYVEDCGDVQVVTWVAGDLRHG